MRHNFEYRFRAPIISPEQLGGKPPAYQHWVENGVVIDRDVAVTMRDGVKIYIDVFRPQDQQAVPVLIAWGPYGKHGTWHLMQSVYHMGFPAADVPVDKLSSYTVFEAPDPMYWAPRGYAVITVNPRGTWYSEGDATFVSPEEAQDEYDLIEWAGTQPWSNGKVGLMGVSYLAFSQYGAAALNPPHLAAINPWEGWSDFYREVVRHGGIPETEFWSYLPNRWGASSTRIEDVRLETQEHPFFDEFWASKNADLAKITVPAYVVASWSDQGIHTRGTLEAYKKISSKQKWLEVHGRKKWAYFYEPESLRRQQAFFDCFLKDVRNEVTEWPVRVEVRSRYAVASIRTDREWPLAQTQYTKLYLDAQSGSLKRNTVAQESSCRYEARTEPGESPRAQFDFKFDQSCQLIGHMKLKVWMAPQNANDMDIFVAIQKVDVNGKVVGFTYLMQFEDGPVALGWLRASHREQDPEKSTVYQPVLLHRREMKLTAGEVVPLEIEILPSGTRFEPGESLRLIVQGSDIYMHNHGPQHFHKDTVNRGYHVLHTGGRYDSYLLVPVTAD